jgi:II/X family phage/plasmid replication protein
MWDKFDIEVPFADQFVNELASSSLQSRAGWVDFKQYNLPLVANVRMQDGVPVIQDLKNRKWETISSGNSGMALGVYPEGNGFNRWPHIRIKASPAKILQGHNVFGSECPKHGIAQMWSMLSFAFPVMHSHLDIQAAKVCYTDSTYSARISDFFYRRVIKIFESLATARTNVNAGYIDRGYLQLGKGSDRQRQKIYDKLQDLIDDLNNAKRRREHHRVAVLSDPRLHDFTRELRRFEATTGPRKFEDLGIPTRLFEFIKFCDWFEAVHKKPLCQYLWELAFQPLFDQIEGHTMKNVDDSHVKLKIDAKFIRIKDNGRVCKRKANAIYQTYRAIKTQGYDALAAEDSSTFFRNVKHLEDIGLSRAFLKSLDPERPAENIVPIVQLIKIDFSNQRPDWYEEPRAGFDCPSRQLRLVS